MKYIFQTPVSLFKVNTIMFEHFNNLLYLLCARVVGDRHSKEYKQLINLDPNGINVSVSVLSI